MARKPRQSPSVPSAEPQAPDRLVGHAGSLHAFRRLIVQHRLPASWLITGPAGIGKQTLSRMLARDAMCLSPNADGSACLVCSSCQKLRAGVHPELHVIEPATDATLIWQLWDGHTTPRTADPAQCGLIGRHLAYAPLFGARQVFVMTQAETLTEAAANSLLKTLEEPPEYALFLLCAPAPDDVLGTIRSRCAQMALGPVAVDEIRAWLCDVTGRDEASAQMAARASRGRPGQALRLCTDPEVQALYQAVAETAEAICREPYAHALRLAEELRRHAAQRQAGSGKQPGRRGMLEVLDALAVWLRDAMTRCMGLTPDMGLYPSLEPINAPDLPPAVLQAMLDICLDVRRTVSRNANMIISTDVMVIRLLRARMVHPAT